MRFSKELVQSLRDDLAFKEFVQYLYELILELGQSGDIEGLRNEDIGENVRARLAAKETLEEALKPFLEFADKKEQTEEEKAQIRRKFGL